MYNFSEDYSITKNFEYEKSLFGLGIDVFHDLVEWNVVYSKVGINFYVEGKFT